MTTTAAKPGDRVKVITGIKHFGMIGEVISLSPGREGSTWQLAAVRFPGLPGTVGFATPGDVEVVQ